MSIGHRPVGIVEDFRAVGRMASRLAENVLSGSKAHLPSLVLRRTRTGRRPPARQVSGLTGSGSP